MHRVKVAVSIAFLLIVGLCVFPALQGRRPVKAFSSGPPPGRTGAPGEGTCLFCHFTYPINDPSGWVRFGDLPATYSPGERINFTVNVFQDGSKEPRQNWGFEVTVLDSQNHFVGTLVATDPVNTQIISGEIGDGTRFYAAQTAEGTFLGQELEMGTWPVAWDAPAKDVGPVTFYVAGNAANGNGDQTGDYIFTNSQGVAGPAAASASARLIKPLPSVLVSRSAVVSSHSASRFRLESVARP